MERPAKRIRLSEQDDQNTSRHGLRQSPRSTSAAQPAQHNRFAVAPTRTINLADLQRPTDYLHGQLRVRGRNAGMVIRPREPDATVTSDAVVVAVNSGTITSEIPAPTADTTVAIANLGTLTLPAIDSSISSAVSGLSSGLSSVGSLLTATNSTTLASTTERTVTVTSTSTYSVSYANGTFILPTATRNSASSSSSDSSDTSTSADTYTFGEGFTYSSTATSTGNVLTTGGVAGVGATPTSSGATSTSSSSSGGGSSAPALTPKQAQTVGGVVGGVAGVAFVLVIVLYVLRWYRQRLKSQGRLPEQLVGPDHNEKQGVLGRSVASLAQSSRSSFFPGFPGHKLRLGSDVTELTETTSPAIRDSEKGFTRLSGRKIAPVLPNGGDPYGGNYGVFEQPHFQQQQQQQQQRHNLTESSFYRDSAGIYIGRHNTPNPPSHSEPTSPTLTGLLDRQTSTLSKRPSLSSFPAPPSVTASDFAAGISSPTRRDGFAMMRSSPARTPVSQSPASISIKLPIQASVTMDEDIPEMPLSPRSFAGAVGQSLQAQQVVGSRYSQRSGSTGRFREEI